jgi:hypothetical protein
MKTILNDARSLEYKVLAEIVDPKNLSYVLFSKKDSQLLDSVLNTIKNKHTEAGIVEERVVDNFRTIFKYAIYLCIKYNIFPPKPSLIKVTKALVPYGSVERADEDANFITEIEQNYTLKSIMDTEIVALDELVEVSELGTHITFPDTRKLELFIAHFIL